MNKTWIVDIEMYPNLFLIVGKNRLTKEYRKYQISPIQDDRHQLIDWLREETEELVGFNILQYDYPLAHYFITKLYPKNLQGREVDRLMKEKSNQLIEETKSWKNIIRHPLRKITDLFKIRHYDNKAKMTSLKLLAFNLRMPNIQELPYHHTKVLTNEEIQNVIEYCINDVKVTDALYDKTKEDIELREKLGPLYGLDMTNFNDAKLGQEIFVKLIQQKLGLETIGLRTPRSSIVLKEIIFDYIRFQSKEFATLLGWLKLKVITETKGTFTEIPFDELIMLENLYKVKIKKGCQENLNIVYKGFQYDFGVGGIHGSISSGIYKSDNEYSIIDIDVTSFYPKLGIENNLYPEHLGTQFPIIYNEVFETRQTYPKKSAPNLGLKLALNGVYGKSNSEHSPFYDPKYTMSITINGQLLLCMLAERIVDEIDNVIILQMNTDGITVKIKNEFIPHLHVIMERWSKYTKLNLEEAEYDMMVIRDVNNYSARYKGTNKIKRKGAAFMYDVSITELEMHKNHSMLVVPMAIEKYFYENILPEEYIPKHKDIYDFFKRVKLPKTFQVHEGKVIMERIEKFNKKGTRLKDKVIEHIELGRELQHITRYFVAKEGHTLIKVMPPNPNKETTDNRMSIIERGWLINECNNLTNVDLKQLRKNINYDYYIERTKRIINAVENNSELELDEED